MSLLILFPFLLHRIQVNFFIIVLADLTFQVAGVESDPFPVIVGFKRVPLHLHKHSFLLTVVIVHLKHRLLSEVCRQTQTRLCQCEFFLQGLLDAVKGVLAQ